MAAIKIEEYNDILGRYQKWIITIPIEDIIDLNLEDLGYDLTREQNGTYTTGLTTLKALTRLVELIEAHNQRKLQDQEGESQ